jgi:hypothetical protein
LAQLEGRFCAPPCDLDNPICPAGSSCNPAPVDGIDYGVCTPDSGQCTPCLDEDGDQRGTGDTCLGTDCNDDNETVYAGAPEFCDGEDNDCDLEFDEDFELTTDVQNCGACGVVCSDNNATSSCSVGECVIDECEPGFVDCDTDPSNGCETDESAATACEACNEDVAVGGECGACGLGTWSCDGVTAICTGGDTPANACGGCAEIAATPGDACGICDTGVWTCAADSESAVCTGDLGDDAFNSCGGCGVLDGAPDDACGVCGGLWECADDSNSVACVDDPTDTDADGVCDADDRCAGFPDSADADGDGIPDGCEDACPDGFYGATCLGECDCLNGTCDDGLEGTGLCTCSTGWDGSACDRCDEGYFGASCSDCPACANGICDEGIGGTGDCLCPPGFDGALCDRCVTGRYGATCAGSCDCVSGTCDAGIDGDGTCECAPGFAGPRCDRCEDGLFGATCSGTCDCVNGTCDEGVGGDGTCTCDTGFEGAACEVCEDGRYGATCSGVCTCANGTCDEGISGDGSCECNDGASGPICDECDAGYFGPDCELCGLCRRPLTCDDGADGSGDCVSDCVPTGSADNTCDGIDDDCDGVADDEFVPPSGFCGCLDCGDDGSGRPLYYREDQTSWTCRRGDLICTPDPGAECISGCI